METEPSKPRGFVRKYAFYFFAPFALMLLSLLVLYAIYGPRVFVAFLYAGM